MTNEAHQDIRWIQRFNNFKKALAQLNKFMQRETLNELEEQGLIQSFEYTHELAWKVQKDFLESQGAIDLFGAKNAAREAFKTGLIKNGEAWMSMIKSRNLTSHTYNEETTQEIVQAIKTEYFDEFCRLEKRFDELVEKELEEP
jgi:nucleotidyltransferase substrate binding protein (TIGR01987 family)